MYLRMLTMYQEQEQLIQQLASNDASATQIYKSFFMIIPIVASLVFLQPLIRPTDSSAFFQAIMSLTSLAATGYILYYKPLGPKAKTPAGRSLGKDQIQQLDQAHAGPIDKYIVYLNLGLAGVLALSGYAGKVATGDPTRLSLGMIPGCKFFFLSFGPFPLGLIRASEPDVISSGISRDNGSSITAQIDRLRRIGRSQVRL